MATYIYIGPWVWETETDEGPHWRAPEGTLGLIDLRPWDACAAKVSHPLNFGLFVTDRLLGSEYVLLASDIDETLKPAAKSALVDALGLPALNATTFRDALIEILLQRADPEQVRMTGPLVPRRDGMWDVILHPWGHIFEQPFSGTSDVGWPTLQARLQRDYRSLREACLVSDSDIYLKKLSYDAGKLGVDPRLLVPADLPYEGTRPRDTEYSDDFNRGDGAIGGNWTAVDPDGAGWVIESNEVRAPTVSSVASPTTARYESNLATDDHLGQIDWTWGEGNSSRMGPVVRFAAAAETAYYGWLRDNAAYGSVIAKVVTGTNTYLVNNSTQHTAPQTIKLSADGTTLTLYDDGVQELQTTDATISGNLRCGLNASSNTSYEGKGDAFYCADLGAPPTTTTLAATTTTLPATTTTAPATTSTQGPTTTTQQPTTTTAPVTTTTPRPTTTTEQPTTSTGPVTTTTAGPTTTTERATTTTAPETTSTAPGTTTTERPTTSTARPTTTTARPTTTTAPVTTTTPRPTTTTQRPTTTTARPTTTTAPVTTTTPRPTTTTERPTTTTAAAVPGNAAVQITGTKGHVLVTGVLRPPTIRGTIP